MKNIFILILLCSLNLFSQTDTVRSKVPEIELPDFVITGRATVELPQQKKNTPDLITPLSREFILPRIKIQELKLEGLSDPSKQQPSIIDTSIKYNGRVRIAAGLYSLPEGDFFYSSKIDIYKFFVGGDFINSRDYEKNSRFFNVNLFANSSFIIKKEDQPPARFNINSNYNLFRYSNFKSFSSDTFNNITNLNINGSFENLFYREFNLTFGGNFDFQKLSRWDFSFAEISAFGTLKSSFEHFEMTASAQPFLYKISKDSTKNKLILSAYSELYFRKLLNICNIIARMDYQTEDESGKQFIATSARVGLGLSDYWTLTLFYENKLLNKTPINLWDENPYLDFSSYNYSIERIKNRFGFGTIIYFDRSSNLKFEFSKYNVIGKNVFIVDNSKDGYFRLKKLVTDVIEISTFIYIDMKKYGDLLMDLKYINSKLKSTTREEPHTPRLQSRLFYTYKFNFPLSLSFNFLYNSVSYGDTNLTMKIDPYLNLGLGFDYQLLRWLNGGIKFNNLMNKKNYRWFNYNEKPIDILIYLKTRF